MSPIAVSNNALRRHSLERRAFDVLSALNAGPATLDELSEGLLWTRHQVRTAIGYARDFVCPELDLAIPHPVPDDGYCYHLTGEWITADGTPAIEAGTAFALGQLEARLRSIHRDVLVAVANLDRQSINGQKVNFLANRLEQIFATLGRIGTQKEGAA